MWLRIAGFQIVHDDGDREYVTQVTAMGPLELEYLSAKDDPRQGSR
jgi:hypothetical protein